MERNSDASSAIATVMASGPNIFPSIPSRERIGMKVMAMISSPKILGFLTSITAFSTVNNLGCFLPSSLKVALDVFHLNDGRVYDHADGNG